jgi:hypothetical protein
MCGSTAPQVSLVTTNVNLVHVKICDDLEDMSRHHFSRCLNESTATTSGWGRACSLTTFSERQVDILRNSYFGAHFLGFTLLERTIFFCNTLKVLLARNLVTYIGFISQVLEKVNPWTLQHQPEKERQHGLEWQNQSHISNSMFIGKKTHTI